MFLYNSCIRTPIGWLECLASDQAITAIRFLKDVNDRQPTNPNAILQVLEQELMSYFSGSLGAFTVPLHPKGTPFQQKVWQGVMDIGPGKTTTYRELTDRLGNPLAIRAVARANGANPIPIVIPCHRVIGSDGSLTGYAGGLSRKAWLLKHEGILIPATSQTGLFD